MGRIESAGLPRFSRSREGRYGVRRLPGPAGQEHPRTKALKGFGGRGVLELVAAHDGNAYRAVCTVRFETALYVLHAFQKKSKTAAATPKKEIELIKKRLQDVETIEQASNEQER